MKKLPLILISILCSSTMFGQSLYRPVFQKGTVLTGLNTSFDFGSAGYYGSSQAFTLTPKLGLFIFDGVAIGLEADFSSISYEYTDEFFEFQDHENTFGPFLKFYSRDGLFVQADYSIGTVHDKYNYGYPATGEYAVKIKKLQIGLGYCFFATRSFAIEPSLMYQHYKRNSDDANSFSDLKKNGIALSFGFSFFLSGKSNSD